jgi:hypothetical protein
LVVHFVKLKGFKLISLCNMKMRWHDNICQSYLFLTKRIFLPNIVDVHIVGGKSHSFPWLMLCEVTYEIVVSVPAENTTDIYTHTSPLIPQVVPTRLTLCGQRCIRYENVFTFHRGGPRDISRSPYTRCAVMTSRMIDT